MIWSARRHHGVRGTARQQQGDFVPAEAADDVVASAAVAEQPGKLHQDVIAAWVAEVIVHRLEVVDVDGG